jgi:hypothetical protein
MKREEMINSPELTGSVRVLGTIDVEVLKSSLQKFIDIAQTGVTQQGLRWAGDFEGVSDLRYNDANPKKYIEEDFKDWILGTEYLQSISKSLNIRDVGRVRMLMMKPKSTYSLHHDPDLWRVHIPLITNTESFMFVDGKMWHLPLGNAYLVKVKDHHLAVNAGNENRIHIVFDYCVNLAT